MAESPELRHQRLREALQRRGATLPREFVRLADAVWNEAEEGHTECLTALPRYVSAEVDGARMAALYPSVKHHLDRCNTCAAHYIDLLEVALADLSDQLPQPEYMPAPDLSFLPEPRFSIREWVEQRAREIVALLSPDDLRELQEIADRFFDLVEDMQGRFSLESRLGEPLAFSSGQVGPALNALALSYATALQLRRSVTADSVHEWSQQGTLEEEIHARALDAADEIGMGPRIASRFARVFAAQVARHPAVLLALLVQ